MRTVAPTIRHFLAFTLALATTDCGVNLAAESSAVPSSAADEVAPGEASSPNAAAPSLEPNTGSANATDANVSAGANAVLIKQGEPGLTLGVYATRALSLSSNAAADATPLSFVDSSDPNLATFSFYGGKFYASGGCAARQHKAGGYMVLLPCDDANVLRWQTSGNNTLTFTSDSNFDNWHPADCPSRAMGGKCYASEVSVFAVSGINVTHGQIKEKDVPQGVLVHLAADTNRCLTDDGGPGPRVLPCNLRDEEQLWTTSFFSNHVRGVAPFRSGRNRCIERPAQPSTAKMADCSSPNALADTWSVDPWGHVWVTTAAHNPLKLTYDAKTDTVSFTRPSSTALSTVVAPVWGFGPVPRASRNQAP